MHSVFLIEDRNRRLWNGQIGNCDKTYCKPAFSSYPEQKHYEYGGDLLVASPDTSKIYAAKRRIHSESSSSEV
jgi:hypothetical protein